MLKTWSPWSLLIYLTSSRLKILLFRSGKNSLKILIMLKRRSFMLIQNPNNWRIFALIQYIFHWSEKLSVDLPHLLTLTTTCWRKMNLVRNFSLCLFWLACVVKNWTTSIWLTILSFKKGKCWRTISNSIIWGNFSLNSWEILKSFDSSFQLNGFFLPKFSGKSWDIQ